MHEHSTDESRSVQTDARALAVRWHHPNVDAPHYLLALLGTAGSNGCRALEAAGLRHQDVLETLQVLYARTASSPPPLTADAKHLIKLWLTESVHAYSSIVDTAHLALACSHGDELPSLRQFVTGRELAIRRAALDIVRRSERLQADRRHTPEERARLRARRAEGTMRERPPQA